MSLPEPVVKVQADLQRPHFRLQVDLSLPGRGVTVFFGASGSGKTTLLRLIAGLEQWPSASVTLLGEVWQAPDRFLPVHRRSLGFVFQEASLFAHLSARQNLQFAQQRAHPGPSLCEWDQVIDLLGLAALLDQRPDQLSGGERQRVAIARALLVNPKVLLMDEPLASLDEGRKQEILPYLEQLKRTVDRPILYVSHSPTEVARLADHLVVLEKGQVKTQGAIESLLSDLNLPVRLGEDAGAVITGQVEALDSRWHLAQVQLDGASLWIKNQGMVPGQTVRLRVLARDISLALSPHADSSILNILEGTVMGMKVDNHPALTLVQLKIGTHLLLARVSSQSADRLGLRAGLRVWAQIKSVAIL